MKKINYLSWIFAVFSAIFLSACEKQPEIISLNGKTMGTTYHIKYLDKGNLSQKAEQVHQQIELMLKDVNAKMSTYDKHSELSRFNQRTEINTPISISADLAKVVKESIRLNKVTEGALDVTVGPVVNLWGFGPEKQKDVQPEPQQLAERQSWVGIDKLKFIENGGQFYLEKAIPQLYIDLSAIAKGFGVDQVADYLQELNVQDYMVEIGGEIRAKGKNPDGKPWQIAIEQPSFDGTRSVQKIVGLDNLAMATSGDYRNYFEQDGKRFSHEINPKTGYPIQHNLASVTVMHESSMTADGLSTALFVLGEEKALALAELENLAVYLISKTDKGFESKMSSKMTALLEQSAK